MTEQLVRFRLIYGAYAPLLAYYDFSTGNLKPVEQPWEDATVGAPEVIYVWANLNEPPTVLGGYEVGGFYNPVWFAYGEVLAEGRGYWQSLKPEQTRQFCWRELGWEHLDMTTVMEHRGWRNGAPTWFAGVRRDGLKKCGYGPTDVPIFFTEPKPGLELEWECKHGRAGGLVTYEGAAIPDYINGTDVL